MFRHGNAAQAVHDVQHTSEKQWAMTFVESDESHVSNARLFGYVLSSSVTPEFSAKIGVGVHLALMYH